MREFNLFAVTASGPQPLLVPVDAQDFSDLYAGLSLGVYSAWRTFGHNRFLHLAAHLARTRRSMELLGWEMALDETAVRHALHAICTQSPYPEMRVRLDVLAEPAYAFGTDSRILLALTPFAPLPQSFYQTGVRLGIARGLERERPLAKTADFAVKRRAFLPNHVYEYLMLDKMGRILEGTGSNFYAVRAGVVWTAGEGVLAGITRQILLDLLPDLGITLHLEPIRASEILDCDEAAISSSSRGWLPAVEIDGQQVGNGLPGPVSQRIMAAYNEYVAGVVETAV